MRSRVCIGCLFVGLVWAGAPLPQIPSARAQEVQDRTTGTLVGWIVGTDREPVGNVLVLVAGRERTTGPGGRFRVDSLAEGVYALPLLHPDRGWDTLRAPVTGGKTTGIVIRFGRDGDPQRRLHLGGLPRQETAAVTPDTASASSRLVGRLLDEKTGEAIPSAVVRLSNPERQATTSERGRFVFDSVPTGTRQLRIHHVRYGDRTTEVDVPAGRTVRAEIALAPHAVAVDPLQVQVDVDAPGLRESGFRQRRQWSERLGRGNFLGPEALEERSWTSVTQLLSTLPGVAVSRGLPFFLGTAPRMGGASANEGGGGNPLSGGGGGAPLSTSANKACFPAVYVDGMKIRGSGPAGSGALGPGGIDGLLSVADLAAVEAYDGAAEIPGEFAGSDARCGVVALWTR